MATTITVPVELRDRINKGASERGVSAAGFIEGLLDAYDRRRRMKRSVELSATPTMPTGMNSGNGKSHSGTDKMSADIWLRDFLALP